MNTMTTTSEDIEFKNIFINDKNMKVPPNSYGLYGNSRIYSCSPPPEQPFADRVELDKMFYLKIDEDEEDEEEEEEEGIFNKHSLSSSISSSSLPYNPSGSYSIRQEYRSILDAHVEKIAKNASLVLRNGQKSSSFTTSEVEIGRPEEDEVVVVAEGQQEKTKEFPKKETEYISSRSKSLPINISRSKLGGGNEQDSRVFTEDGDLCCQEPLSLHEKITEDNVMEQENIRGQGIETTTNTSFSKPEKVIVGSVIPSFEASSPNLAKELILSAQPYQYGTSPYQQSYMKNYSNYSCASSVFLQSNSNSTRSSSPTPLEDDDAETLCINSTTITTNPNYNNPISKGIMMATMTTVNEVPSDDNCNLQNEEEEVVVEDEDKVKAELNKNISYPTFSYDASTRSAPNLPTKSQHHSFPTTSSSYTSKLNSYYQSDKSKWNAYGFSSNSYNSRYDKYYPTHNTSTAHTAPTTPSKSGNSNDTKRSFVLNDSRHGRHYSYSSGSNVNYSFPTTPENEKVNVGGSSGLPSSRKSSSSLFSSVSRSLNSSNHNLSNYSSSSMATLLNNSINSRRSSFSDSMYKYDGLAYDSTKAMNTTSSAKTAPGYAKLPMSVSNLSLNSTYSSSTLGPANSELYQTLLENEVYRQQSELQKTRENKDNEKKRYQQYLIDLEKEFQDKSLSWNSPINNNTTVLGN